MAGEPIQIRAAYSPRIDKDTNENEELRSVINRAFELFFDGAFGLITDEQQAINEKAIERLEGTVTSKYHTENGDIYIKMELVDKTLAIATAMYCEEDI